ncbi:uncharacterized protein EV420DRAFT_1523738 [Desarmillaria tabescens]|uniref:F-box domain-containing protein n=1 Tax=Armillaria tabescens TaxID=1929756 RepID=A0AA39TKG6_ARMTA|nr:uncharacterized protein EV420DRAFT_1523738 [Desarmillaria tabescens]KAK0462237.1 hypothetical protein EV420DRAFT_1523738 [Desarmillaria tabescens]
MAISFPAELLELFVIEASIPTRKALRSTCKALRSIATPFVFENLFVDTRNKKRPFKFLKYLSSEKGFAKYVLHLHLVSLTFQGKSMLGLRKEKDCEKLLVAAIPYMTSLKSISCSASDKRIVTNASLWSSLNHITAFSITNWDGNQPMSISGLHLPHLTSLSYSGTGSLDTHLTTLNIHYSKHPDDRPNPFTPMVYVVFHRFRSTCLTSLSLSGNISLGLLEVYFLVPILRRLQSLSLNLDSVPPEFWMELRRQGVFIKDRFALTTWEADDSVFDYLCSYIGLQNLFLRIKDGEDDLRAKGVVRKHRTTLRSVDIAKPSSLVSFHIWVSEFACLSCILCRFSQIGRLPLS